MKPERRKDSKSVVEEMEPTAIQRPVPVTFIVVVVMTLFGGMLYLDQAAGGFNEHVYTPMTSLAQLEELQPKDPAAKLAAQGKAIFATTCSACHGAAGTGTPNIAPPLAGSEWPQAPGSGRVIRIVLNGLMGPVDVKGTSYNLNMPPLGSVLTDDQIAAVLTFERGNKEWGHNASAVSPEQVKAVRAQARDAQWTAPELQKISDAE